MRIHIIRFLLLLFIIFISACGEKPLDEAITNDSNNDAVLLKGDASTLAVAAISDFDLNDGIPESDTDINSEGRTIALNEIEIWLTGQSTVGEVNDLLRSIDASIVNSLAGMPFLLVRIPNQGSANDLETLIAEVEINPVVTKVYSAGFFSTEQLPDNISSDPATIALPDSTSEIDLIGNQLAIKAHAAWNASQALDSFMLSTPPVMIVADYFGGGKPNGDYDVSIQDDSDFSLNHPDKHGYHVLGIIAAKQGGSDTPRGWATGIYPGKLPLRVVDAITNSGYKLSILAIENKILKRIRNYSGTKLVLNTSVGAVCGPSNAPVSCSASTMENDAIRWIKKVRDAGLENKFIHVTSAGNRLTDGNMDARHDSQYTAAGLVNNLSLSDGTSVTNLSNILVVENLMKSSLPFKPVCISGKSKYGGNISAIGSGVWSLTGASSSADWDSGTSMSAPQVAGLVAYVWALAPGLSTGEVINLISDNSRYFQATPSADLGCGQTQPASALDAYASVLAVDRESAINGSGQPVDARIRGTILDIADNTGAPGSNGQFDENDLEIWLYMFQTAITELDYSRYDLNGDGWTGGDTTDRFDLDIDHRFLPRVSQDIEAETINFNENSLTDMQVLCYYAYSPLYTGDVDERTTRMSPYLDQCGGKAWGTPEVIGAGNLLDLAGNDAGNATAVWLGVQPGVIVSSRYSKDVGWGTPASLGTSWSAQVAMGINSVIAVWRESVGQLGETAVFARHYLSGSGWQGAANIDAGSNTYSGRSRIGMDAAGNATVVWENNGTDVLFNRYVAGTGWGTARAFVTGIDDDVSSPDVAKSRSGYGMAVWEQYDGSNQDGSSRSYIYASYQFPDGSWQAPQAIEGNNGNCNNPKVAVSNSGNAVAVWQESNGAGYSVYANFYTAGAGWGHEQLLETGAGRTGDLEVAIDDAGNATAIWKQANSARTNFDIWANYYAVGIGWQGAERVESGSSRADAPQVVMQGDSGRAIAVWQQDGHVYASYYTPGDGWRNAETIDTDAGIGGSPQIVIDDEGNAIASWSNDGIVYVNRYE